MRTASRPAFLALPTATVATGTPPGICTIDSSESRPSSCASGTGTPITGSGVIDAVMPGQVRGAAGTGDDHPQAPVGRRPGVLVHHVGRAVRRDDAHLVRHAELGEHVDRGLHHRQIGVAAHDHADERSIEATPSTLMERTRRGLQRWAHANTTDRDARHRAPRDAGRDGRRLLPRGRRRGLRRRRLRHARRGDDVVGAARRGDGGGAGRDRQAVRCRPARGAARTHARRRAQGRERRRVAVRRRARRAA